MANTHNKEIIEKYKDFPTEKSVCEISGKRYSVTRHFVGDKDIALVIEELAIIRADRETFGER